MKTLRSLRAVALILLVEMLAPRVCSAGTVTLTGGGKAELFYSGFGQEQDPVWAQAGTFLGLTDVDIMELARAPDALLEYWAPFAAAVPIGCFHAFCFNLPEFPPDRYAGFNLSATVALDPSSPLHGRPVYVILYYLGSWSDQLVVHKTAQSFPSGDNSVEIHVAINPASPRLLAGGLVNRPGFPAETVTPCADSAYQNWAFAWFGENHPQSGPDDDADGDAHTNNDERFDRTNPLDAASLLELQWVSRNEDSATFTWQTIPGARNYIVQSDTPLIPRPTTWPANFITVSTTRATATVPVPPGATRRFFAVFLWW